MKTCLFLSLAAVLLLTAVPAQAQDPIPCDFCRWVLCPDAPYTLCSFAGQVMTCQDWGVCWAVGDFQATLAPAAAKTSCQGRLSERQDPGALRVVAGTVSPH